MTIARLTSYGAGKAEFTGLTPEEVDMMQAASVGNSWVKISEVGRVEKCDAFQPLPKPTDANMEPFWRKNQEVQEHLGLDDFEPLPTFSEPSISIQHLCGYGYTPTKYAAEAANLTRWGFECLRSKRNDQGRFWEIWHLAGFWMAKEELKSAIDKAGDNMPKRIEAAKSFLARNARFGSLDMSCQRLAMVID